MEHVHVVSCGAGSLFHLANEGSIPFPPGGGRKKASADDIAAKLTTDSAARKRAEQLALEQPKWFPELSAMDRYLNAKQVDVAYLIGTETAPSRLHIGWLRKHLEARGVTVEQGTPFAGFEEDAPGNDGENLEEFAQRLQVLRARTLDYVKRCQARDAKVFIAAQGGFKPEVGVMMLVGEEARVPVYYAHEQMLRSIDLPVFLYHGDLEPLRALADKGGYLRGDDATLLEGRHRELMGKAVEAHAVEAKRDDDGGLKSLKLTAYGKHLLATEKGA